ncbi:MAG: tripartite tricarboxylate transporter TctB family protein [Anaerolineae bacterium]
MSKDKRLNLISAALCLALAAYVIYLTLTTFVEEEATGGGPFANSAFYPQLVAGAIVLLSILLIGLSFVKGYVGRSVEAESEQAPQVREPVGDGQALEERPRRLWRSLAIAALLILYTLLLDLFGYLAVTPPFMALLFWTLGIRRWIAIVSLSLGSTLSFYVFFAWLLDVILPAGRYSLTFW